MIPHAFVAGVGHALNTCQDCGASVHAHGIPARDSAIDTGLALTVLQPWAWLIVQGFKPVENRDWPTKIRGRFWIHAGKRFDFEGYSWVRHRFPELRAKLPTPAGYEHGGVVGRVTLVDCVTAYPSLWFTGHYGFVVADPLPLPFAPCRGQLGFFRPKFPATSPTT